MTIVARRKPAARQQKVKPVRPGLPSPDSIREVITRVAPTGRRFTILRTNEADAYDKPQAPKKRGKP